MCRVCRVCSWKPEEVRNRHRDCHPGSRSRAKSHLGGGQVGPAASAPAATMLRGFPLLNVPPASGEGGKDGWVWSVGTSIYTQRDGVNLENPMVETESDSSP